MIVKRVKADKVKDKGEHIAHLIKYITNDKPNANELDWRVGQVITRGFMSTDLPTQIAEMQWLAAECVRSKNPLNHYVMSWREGEHPTDAQAEAAVDIFTDQLGLTGCQVIAALHTDTENRHLHIAVNRIHQETLAAIEINKGFDREAAHQAIARIEHAQGWTPEKGARFVVGADGELVSTKKPKPEAQPLPGGATDFEIRTGEQSHARQAIEAAGDVFKNAASWDALHQELHGLGMKYTRVGSGAVIEFEGEILKASTVSRSASFPKLQKKLGEYEPAGASINDYFKHEPELHTGKTRTLGGNSLRELSQCRLASNEQGKAAGVLQVDVGADRRTIASLRRESAARVGARAGADRGRDAARVDWGSPDRGAGRGRVTGAGAGEFGVGAGGGVRRTDRGGAGRDESRADGQSALADQRLFGDWQKARREQREGKEAGLLAIHIAHDKEFKAIKARHAALRTEIFKGKSWRGKGEARNAFSAAIKLDHDSEVKMMRDRQAQQRAAIRAKWQGWSDYEAWLASKGEVQAIDQRRYRHIEIVFIIGYEFRQARPVAIAGYDTIIDKESVHYRRKGADEIAFTDRGSHISIFDGEDEQVVLDAMLIAKAKWGSVEINGNAQFKELCVRLAVENGIAISNQELQASIEAARLALPAPMPLLTQNEGVPEPVPVRVEQKPVPQVEVLVAGVGLVDQSRVVVEVEAEEVTAAEAVPEPVVDEELDQDDDNKPDESDYDTPGF